MAFAGLWNIVLLKKLVIKNETFLTHKWRIFIRPFSVFFILVDVIFSKNSALVFIGSIGLAFILLDLIRLSHQKTNEYLTVKITTVFKKGEEHKFSSITTFLVAAFISILLFSQKIAFCALIFLTFGDMFGKIFRIHLWSP